MNRFMLPSLMLALGLTGALTAATPVKDLLIQETITISPDATLEIPVGAVVTIDGQEISSFWRGKLGGSDASGLFDQDLSPSASPSFAGLTVGSFQVLTVNDVGGSGYGVQPYSSRLESFASGGTGMVFSDGANIYYLTGGAGQVLTGDGGGGYAFVTPQAATTSSAGLLEIATNAEVQTGTDSVRAVVPSALAAFMTWWKTQAHTFAAAVTLSSNLVMNGTNNTAPNQVGQTPGSTTVLVKSQADALYGEWPAGQTVAVWNNITYVTGSTAGKVLRGTISCTNNTETKLFNAAAFGNDRVGPGWFVFGNGTAGAGGVEAIALGNQGTTEVSDAATNVRVSAAAYWVSFGSNLTLATGDTLTGNSTGATAKVWRGSGLPGSVADCWLYDVTGIFTSADTNLSINGTPSGIGVSNSAWGATPSASEKFFIYMTRDASANIIPAVFNRFGSTQTCVFEIKAY